MSGDVYTRLREFLDSMPGAYPETPSGVERKMLEKLFTPEEAEMLVGLNQFPETPAAIAARLGMEEAAAAELLERMARQGDLLRIRMGEMVMYMPMSFLVGVYEFHVKTMDREFAEMMEEYESYLVDSWLDVKTKQLRVIPIGASLESDSAVAPYDDIRKIVATQDSIAVANCVCRVKQGLLDKRCDRPLESCLLFGGAAEFYVENEIGRRISREECMKILDEAEAAALVVSPSNAQEPSNVCLCCKCCCGMLANLGRLERPADHFVTSHVAEIDQDMCLQCATCVDRCQMDAIVDRHDHVEVDTARCIGCGLCVPTCEGGAMMLKEKPGVEAPPANFVEMNVKILQERGI